MIFPRRAALIAAVLALAAPAAAADEAIRAGAYEVEVRLELPHLENHDVKRARICVAASDAGHPAALPVLSENNPLARCPAINLRRYGNELRFEIACAGVNAGKAWAIYDLSPDAFQGRIAMTMGGKNMTMTEVQRGRRVGECDPAAH